MIMIMMIMMIMEYYQLSKSGKALSNDFASIPRTVRNASEFHRNIHRVIPCRLTHIRRNEIP